MVLVLKHQKHQNLSFVNLKIKFISHQLSIADILDLGGTLNLSGMKDTTSLLNLSGMKEASGGVLELCVVCGDRASGTSFYLLDLKSKKMEFLCLLQSLC